MNKASLFVMAVAAVVSGCASGATDAGLSPVLTSQYVSETGAVAGVTSGGLVGSITAAKLSRAEIVSALEAEYRTLESTPGGQKVTWDGRGGTRGEVVAAQPYSVGSQNCRQYSHVLEFDGNRATARGTACRNEDGTWTPLS